MAGNLLSYALEDFLTAKDMTDKSRKWYDATLRQFLTFCAAQGVTCIEDLDTKTIRQYIRHSQQRDSQGTTKHLSTTTVYGYYLAIAGWLRWCTLEYQLPNNPCLRVEPPKLEEKVLAVFSPTQIGDLLRACRDAEWAPMGARDTAIVSLLIDTGIRLSELASLTLDYVDLTGNEPHIRVNGKGRKQREVGLGKQSRRALEVYLKFHRSKFKNAETSQHVFLTHVGRPLSEGSVHVLMTRLQERTGITDVRVSAHTFRHTFAITYLAQEGADIYKLARLLGHDRVATTEIYLKAFESRQARNSASILDVMMTKR